MKGTLRADSRTVDVDDATLTELHRLGGKVLAVHDGTYVPGELVHDGQTFVIKLEDRMEAGRKRVVGIKPRIVLAQGARQ